MAGRLALGYMTAIEQTSQLVDSDTALETIDCIWSVLSQSISDPPSRSLPRQAEESSSDESRDKVDVTTLP